MPSHTGGARRRHPARPAQGDRSPARYAAGKYAPFRARLAGQQCAAVGRARNGQKLARQSGSRRGQPRLRQSQRQGSRLLIEIHREDIASLPQLLRRLRAHQRQFLLYCDDLSFDKDDTSYKSLKAALEGGIEGRPANVLFYATSNRRHLMPREIMENERTTAINPSEAVEEKVSLSDRFGLWLGFHNCGQDDYLAMIDGYADHYGIARLSKAPCMRARWPGRWRGSRPGPRRLAVHPGHRRRTRSRNSDYLEATSSGRGLTGVASRRISKCSCGEVTSPVDPA